MLGVQGLFWGIDYTSLLDGEEKTVSVWTNDREDALAIFDNVIGLDSVIINDTYITWTVRGTWI